LPVVEIANEVIRDVCAARVPPRFFVKEKWSRSGAGLQHEFLDSQGETA
jgi:hypothetical protein